MGFQPNDTEIDRRDHDAAMLALAERLFAAVAAGDADAVRGLYSPDVAVWHNFDAVAQTRDENLATLTWMARSLVDLAYTECRRRATADGFVQQHVLVATNRRGERVAVPACIVATVAGGVITRLDEYIDSAHVAALTAR